MEPQWGVKKRLRPDPLIDFTAEQRRTLLTLLPFQQQSGKKKACVSGRLVLNGKRAEIQKREKIGKKK